MFLFKDKAVYIISPVKWGKMKVSKHHYAIELAKAGNQVYFIEPPDLKVRGSIVMNNLKDSSGLRLVSYKPIARGRRFLPASIYRWLLRIQAFLLLRKIGEHPDVLISFDPGRFENLRCFHAKHTIFFAGDLFHQSPMPGEIESADICIGVSPTIVNLLKKKNQKSYFIHHGLNSTFAAKAKQLLDEPVNQIKLTRKPVAGYFGNLFMEAMDRQIMQQVIAENQNVQFVFWGMYEKLQDTIVPHENSTVYEFLNFLKKSTNVELRGVTPAEQLIKEIEQVDLFWYCYNITKSDLWDGSNSHKILEYLSTGKPVVSHHVATYAGTSMLYMQPTADNASFPVLFKEVVELLIKEGEQNEERIRRIQFSLANTYQCKIEELELLIQSHL